MTVDFSNEISALDYLYFDTFASLSIPLVSPCLCAPNLTVKKMADRIFVWVRIPPFPTTVIRYLVSHSHTPKILPVVCLHVPIRIEIHTICPHFHTGCIFLLLLQVFQVEISTSSQDGRLYIRLLTFTARNDRDSRQKYFRVYVIPDYDTSPVQTDTSKP